MTRKRRCKACGRATKGHRGPTGIGVCKMDLSGANGVEGESQGAGSQANARPAQSGAPSDSGTAAADNRGSHNVNSGSMAELGVQSSAGGMGPHRYSSIVGLAEGPPAWGAGAPVQPGGPVAASLQYARGTLRTYPHSQGPVEIAWTTVWITGGSTRVPRSFLHRSLLRPVVVLFPPKPGNSCGALQPISWGMNSPDLDSSVHHPPGT